MSQVFRAAAKVCDVLVIVSKNPTRQGQLRRLDKDLLMLMKESGFRPLCYHQAVLFTQERRTDLWGAKSTQARGRLGFFKRLAWQRGRPVADHEDVFFMGRVP